MQSSTSRTPVTLQTVKMQLSNAKAATKGCHQCWRSLEATVNTTSRVKTLLRKGDFPEEGILIPFSVYQHAEHVENYADT